MPAPRVDRGNFHAATSLGSQRRDPISLAMRISLSVSSICALLCTSRHDGQTCFFAPLLHRPSLAGLIFQRSLGRRRLVAPGSSDSPLRPVVNIDSPRVRSSTCLRAVLNTLTTAKESAAIVKSTLCGRCDARFSPCRANSYPTRSAVAADAAQRRPASVSHPRLAPPHTIKVGVCESHARFVPRSPRTEQTTHI